MGNVPSSCVPVSLRSQDMKTGDVSTVSAPSKYDKLTVDSQGGIYSVRMYTPSIAVHVFDEHMNLRYQVDFSSYDEFYMDEVYSMACHDQSVYLTGRGASKNIQILRLDLLTSTVEELKYKEFTFLTVHGICVNDVGNVYCCDLEHHSVWEITAKGVKKLAGTGMPGKRNGACNIASFSHPIDVCAGLDNDIYIAEDTCIRRIDLTTNMVSTVVDEIWNPRNVFYTANRDIYFSTSCYNSLLQCYSEGQLYVVAGTTMRDLDRTTGRNVRSFRDGNGVDARFINISSIVISMTDAIFVTDDGQVRKAVHMYYDELTEERCTEFRSCLMECGSLETQEDIIIEIIIEYCFRVAHGEPAAEIKSH